MERMPKLAATTASGGPLREDRSGPVRKRTVAALSWERLPPRDPRLET
jgi:hypothetical protein